MSAANNFSAKSAFFSASAGKRMLVGAAIGLAVVLFFLVQTDEPNPNWSKFWMIKPLIVVPFAGAMGGLLYSLMDRLRYQGGWKKITANMGSVLVFIVGLWMGLVFGFAGTLWN